MLNWRKILIPAAPKPTIKKTIFHFLQQKQIILPNPLKNFSDLTDFKKDLGLESLDVVEMILFLEQRYKINFDQATHIPCLNTVGALCDFTNALIQRETCLR